MESLSVLRVKLETEIAVKKEDLNRAIREQEEHEAEYAARAIVRLKRQKAQIGSQHNNLTTMSIQLSGIQTHDALVGAMRKSMRCMAILNRQSRQIPQITFQFQRAMMRMKQSDRQLQDSLDDVEELDADDEAEASGDDDAQATRMVDQAREAAILGLSPVPCHLGMPLPCQQVPNKS